MATAAIAPANPSAAPTAVAGLAQTPAGLAPKRRARAKTAADPLTPGAPYFAGQARRWTVGGQWWYLADPSNTGLSARYERTKNFAGWTPVIVPNAWNAGDSSEQSHRGAVGWYAREFVLPVARRSARWVLRFDSVNYRAKVWLNGRKIGGHTGASVPFELDATAMRPGLNRLVVRVDSRLSTTTVPPLKDTRLGTPNGGWWNFGGILREVVLREVDRIDIADLWVEATPRCAGCAARVTVRARLRNLTNRRAKVGVYGTFGRHRLRFRVVSVARRGRAVATAKLNIKRPRLWSIETPALYRVTANARIGRRDVAAYRVNTGVRALRVDRAGIATLNGRRLSLSGTSLHEFSPTEGAALSAATRAAQLALVQRLGANMLRAHYPLSPAVYEFADRAGIMLWTQAPVFRVDSKSLGRRAYRTAAIRYVAEMVAANRNHPAVLAYSLGNELQASSKVIDRYIRGAAKVVRQADPDALTALDVSAEPASYAQHPAYRRVDAIGLNEYFGWYAGADGTAESRESLGPYLDDFHADYPRQALFVTEFGAEANRAGAADEKGTYEFQVNLLNYHLGVIRAKRYVSGTLPWMLQDYWVRPGWDGGNPDPIPPMSSKGFVHADGRIKPAFDEVAREFRATPALRPGR